MAEKTVRRPQAAPPRAPGRAPAGHLDTAERTKSELIDIAVHELRSPLTVVQGYASLLSSGDLGTLSGPATKAVRIIASKSREAQEIATTLLTVARLDSNDLAIDRVPLEVSGVLEEVRARAAPRLELAGASLSVTCPSGMRAAGDAALVARVLDNLVNNALTYSDPPAAVSIRASLDAGDVSIRVSDAGPGVEPEDRDRIFERFVRGAGSDRAAGTGLGLYVSRECARRMGGDLVLEPSRPAAGASFRLTLPPA